VDCVAKGRVWVGDGSRRATDKLEPRGQSKDAKPYKPTLVDAICLSGPLEDSFALPSGCSSFPNVAKRLVAGHSNASRAGARKQFRTARDVLFLPMMHHPLLSAHLPFFFGAINVFRSDFRVLRQFA
jgi:hypothetical protein